MIAKPRMRLITIRLAALCAVLYIALALAAFEGQRAFMYPAPRRALEPRVPGATLERIGGPNGTTVYALYARAPEGAPTIVHFHGNGEDLANQAWLVGRFRDAGVGAFAV